MTDLFSEYFSKALGLFWFIYHRLAAAFEFLLANWVYITIVLALAAGYFLFHEYRQWQKNWLSGLIEEKIRELRRKRQRVWFENLRPFSVQNAYRISRFSAFRSMQRIEIYFESAPRQLKDFYFPSWTSFIFISVVFLCFFLLPPLIYSRLSLKAFGDVFEPLQNGETVKKIFGGLIVIAVGLIIFVAEFIRDSKNAERKRVLLQISNLWPLTLAVTIFPLGYLAGELTGLIVALVVLMSSFAIYAFARILRNLLDADAQEKNVRALLKTRIRSLIMESARERLGNNILLQRLGPDQDIKINYSVSRSWLQNGASSYIFVHHPQTGWLSDINFGELQAIATLLETQAQKLGFEISEGNKTTIGATTRTNQPVQSQPETLPAKKVYLLKRYREQLPQESVFSAGGRAILAIPKELAIDARLIEEVRARTSRAFRLIDAEPSSIAFRREMQATKDQLVASIRALSLGTVDELRTTFLEVAEEFLETLHELGGGYSAEQARKERSNFFEGWNEIRWLTQDVRELLTVSATTDNIDIISDIAFLPFAIATRAVLANDHLLFEEFTAFAPFIYSLAAPKAADSNARSFMIDRSWRYLKDLCEYYILPINLERNGQPIDVGEARDFALFALNVFQNLLKDTYDRDDIATFKIVLTEFHRLFRNFNPQADYPDSDLLKVLVSQTQEEKERAEFQTKLSEQEKKEDAFKRIHLSRQVAIFGLAAHFLDKRVNEPSVAKNRNFYETIEPFLPQDLQRLTEVYEKMCGLRSSDLFDWTRWDAIADGEVRFVDTNTKPDRLYCVRALQLLAKMDSKKAAELNLPSSEAIRMLLTRADEIGVPKVVGSINSQQTQGNRILSADELEQISTFRNLLQKSKIAADDAEQAELISSPIDPEKLAAFLKMVVDTRLQHGRLRPLFKKIKTFVDNSRDSPGIEIPSWGFNQLDDKGAFVAKYRVSYPAWGESYGRGLAQAEDRFGFEKLIVGTAVKLECESDMLFEMIKKEIKVSYLKQPIVIHSLLSRIELLYMKKRDLFIPRYRKDCPTTGFNDLPGFSGVLKLDDIDVPVISLFVTDETLKGKVLVTDLARFASWHQFSAADEAVEKQYIYDSIFIRVVDLNTDDKLRNEILATDPQYLHDQNDKEKYLRTRVVVKVYEKFKVEISEPSGGTVISISDREAVE